MYDIQLLISRWMSTTRGTDNYYHFGYNWSSPHIDEEPDDEYWNYNNPTLQLGLSEYNSEPIFKEHIGVFETVMGK